MKPLAAAWLAGIGLALAHGAAAQEIRIGISASVTSIDPQFEERRLGWPVYERNSEFTARIDQIGCQEPRASP